ncbi:MAG TPA: hypothetical protein VH855_28960 [Acetobacteraceae bacterium]|jgi:hypothetical protein
MAARTLRWFIRNRTTGWQNFNWDGVITANSVVHVSACEAKFFDAENPLRWRGDAPISVKNVRPHGPNPGDTNTGGVEFFLVVEWGSPLDVAVDITVIDTPEQVVL